MTGAPSGVRAARSSNCRIGPLHLYLRSARRLLFQPLGVNLGGVDAAFAAAARLSPDIVVSVVTMGLTWVTFPCRACVSRPLGHQLLDHTAHGATGGGCQLHELVFGEVFPAGLADLGIDLRRSAGTAAQP